MSQRRKKLALKPVPPPATERGRRTQRALMDAALEIMEKGRSFNSLSMREVTSLAGIVPSAFYRHFKNMDQLGLTLVNDAGHGLRPLMRKARMEVKSGNPADIIRESVMAFKGYVEEHPRYYLIAAGERHGGSPLIREAIDQEIELFVDEMVEDLRKLRLFPHLTDDDLRVVGELSVNTMLSAAIRILDMRGSKGLLAKRHTESFVAQLKLIFYGAANWPG